MYTDVDSKETKEIDITRELSNKTFFFTIEQLKAETKYKVSVYCHNEENKSNNDDDDAILVSTSAAGN